MTEDAYEEWAENYDRGYIDSHWHGPDIIFGLMYRNLKPGQAVLDVGIGTGMGTIPFHKAGLKVWGLDSSGSMLKQARKKHLGFELIHHDLTIAPWPLDDNQFDHMVSSGVTHFICDLSLIFLEAARLLKPGGLLGFDFQEYDPDNPGGYSELSEGVFTKRDVEYDHQVFAHTDSYVRKALIEAGLKITIDTEFRVSPSREQYFRAMVVQKPSQSNSYVA